MDERNPRRAVIRYAKHWAALAEEFNSAEFGQIVRYEDILENPDELLKLKDYLELSSLDINFPKNSRADWRAENNTELNMIEKGVISFVAKDGIKYFRY